jgi:hypothetical protein
MRGVTEEIPEEERKEGAESDMKRHSQLSTCGMDVAKWEKGTERNTEWRRKGDKMDERDMEE